MDMISRTFIADRCVILSHAIAARFVSYDDVTDTSRERTQFSSTTLTERRIESFSRLYFVNMKSYEILKY